MTYKMIRMVLFVLFSMLLASCVPVELSAINSEDRFDLIPSTDVIPSNTVDNDDAVTPSVSPQSLKIEPEGDLGNALHNGGESVSTEMNPEEDPGNGLNNGVEIVIPDKEFRNIRDEMLIHILGIDGSLPVFNSDGCACVYVCLPHGGVYAKLGYPNYIVQFEELNLSPDIRTDCAKRFYYSDEGIELDIVYECDQPYDVVRYLYISNSSNVMLPSGIGVGSSRDDVLSIYEPFVIQGFTPMLTSEEVIALGSDVNGIYFVIRDDRVYSIYIAIIGEDSIFSWFLTPSQEYKLYPDIFYPDREYMASIQ